MRAASIHLEFERCSHTDEAAVYGTMISSWEQIVCYSMRVTPLPQVSGTGRILCAFSQAFPRKCRKEEEEHPPISELCVQHAALLGYSIIDFSPPLQERMSYIYILYTVVVQVVILLVNAHRAKHNVCTCKKKCYIRFAQGTHPRSIPCSRVVVRG